MKGKGLSSSRSLKIQHGKAGTRSPWTQSRGRNSVCFFTHEGGQGPPGAQVHHHLLRGGGNNADGNFLALVSISDEGQITEGPQSGGEVIAGGHGKETLFSLHRQE